RRHTRFSRDWSSDVCSSDLGGTGQVPDTLMYRRIRTGTESGRDVERLGLMDPFASQVMDTLIQLGLEISSEGFEGHPIGTIFTKIGRASCRARQGHARSAVY